MGEPGTWGGSNQETPASPSSPRPAAAPSEFKKVIRLLRAELGKARDDLAQEKRRSKNQAKVALSSQNSHAMARAEQLAAELEELKEHHAKVQMENVRKTADLMEEASAHALARQALVALEARFKAVELQVNKQSTPAQQQKVHDQELETMSLKYEAQLADTISKYEAKVAAKEAEVMSLMNTLSGKGEAISSFQADGSGNAPASWRLPHSAARAEEKDEVKQRELLNSMESMQLMLQKAQEDEETARLHAQGLADRLSQGHAELAGETAARLALENEILDMKKQASAEVEAAQSRAEAAESDQETAKSALSAAKIAAAESEDRIRMLQLELQRQQENSQKSEDATSSQLEEMRDRVSELDKEAQTLRGELVRLVVQDESRAAELDEERQKRIRAEELFKMTREEGAGKVERLVLELQREKEMRYRAQEEMKRFAQNIEELTVGRREEDERTARLRAEEALQGLVDEVKSLKAGQLTLYRREEEERTARLRAEQALQGLVEEVVTLKAGHAEKMQAILEELATMHGEGRWQDEMSQLTIKQGGEAENALGERTLLNDLRCNKIHASPQRASGHGDMAPQSPTSQGSEPSHRVLTKTPGRQQSSPNKSHVTKVQQYTVLGGFDEQSSSAELIAHTRKWGGDSPLPRATPREGSLESAAPEERFPAQTANRMRERTPLAGEPSPPLQHPSSLKGTKLSLKSEDVARAGLSGGIGLGLGTIVRSAHWTGMSVTELIPGSPSAQAGVISVGDTLLAVDGEYIDEHNFERVIAKVQGVLGSKVSLTIARAEYKFHVALIRKRVSIGDKWELWESTRRSPGLEWDA